MADTNNADGPQEKSKQERKVFTISEKIADSENPYREKENGKGHTGVGAHGIPVEHPTSYLETFMHLFRGNIGSGIYAMGDAFKNGGIIFGTIMTCFLGFISVHSQHLLLECNARIVAREKVDIRPDFATTVEMCFESGPIKLRKLSRIMKIIVNTFLCITQLGFCCVYFVFVGTNLQKVLHYFGVDMSVHILMVIAFLPMLIVSLVRNLKYLAPISGFANLLMIVGLSITIYYASLDLPPVSSRHYIGTLQSLPLFFGTAIYAFEGIGLVLPLQNEMREPRKFSSPAGVLNVGMVIVTTLMVTVGFLGYLQWGEEVEGSLTLNFPPDKIIGVVVQSLLAVAIIFTYPIQLYVAVDPLLNLITKCCGKSNNITEYILRAGLVVLTFTFAEAIPKLGLFISLIGAVSSTTLALLIPPVLEMVSRSQDKEGVPVIIVIKDVLIILIGLVGFATGTYESIRSIVSEFQ